MRAYTAVVLLWLIASTAASAIVAADLGESSIRLGRVDVSIGMRADEVVKRAAEAKQYLSVPKRMSSDTLILWEDEIVDDRTRALGSIVVKNGAVQHIFKNWTPDERAKVTDVGNAMFAVASEFVAAQRTRCTLGTRLRSVPGQQEQTVTITCGRHSIEVSTVRNDQYAILRTEVTEWVH